MTYTVTYNQNSEDGRTALGAIRRRLAERGEPVWRADTADEIAEQVSITAAFMPLQIEAMP